MLLEGTQEVAQQDDGGDDGAMTSAASRTPTMSLATAAACRRGVGVPTRRASSAHGDRDAGDGGHDGEPEHGGPDVRVVHRSLLSRWRAPGRCRG